MSCRFCQRAEAGLRSFAVLTKTDSPRDGRMGLLDAWHFTSQGVGKAVSKARMSDQLRFLVENQKSFYEDMVKFFRRDLGARNLVSCSNWITADAAALDSPRQAAS